MITISPRFNSYFAAVIDAGHLKTVHLIGNTPHNVLAHLDKGTLCGALNDVAPVAIAGYIIARQCIPPEAAQLERGDGTTTLTRYQVCPRCRWRAVLNGAVTRGQLPPDTDFHLHNA